MKLVRPLSATLLAISLSLGLFALQMPAAQRFGRGRDYYSRRTQRALGVLLEPAPVHFQLCQRQQLRISPLLRRLVQDYPKADNDCLIALRRLTHINSPSPLNVVDLDSDHLFDYPWIYAVQVNTWTFTDQEAKRLHDYLLKGGFLMVDDFHGTDDWEHFMAGMRMVLPDRPVEDLKDNDEIYHVLYDINEKFQIPSEVYVNTGRTYEKDGYVPKWRAIRNDHGRIMVAICANMHLGDAWEWADSPEYPEKFSGLAFRIVLNYITYAMTH